MTVLDSTDLRPITLVELLAVGELQDRFDTKHLVPIERLDLVVGALLRRSPSVSVLEVDGVRWQAYASEYFDTTDLRSYRDHVQGRRRRYKVRTRRYGDGAAVAEVKMKDGRGRTVKHRLGTPIAEPTRLDDDAQAEAENAIQSMYPDLDLARLGHSASINFRRMTLAFGSEHGGERVTIDRHLTVARHGVARELGPSHAIVEVKSDRFRGVAASALIALGHRPVPVSKYGLAVASTGGADGSHPWVPTLRTLRAPGPGSGATRRGARGRDPSIR